MGKGTNIRQRKLFSLVKKKTTTKKKNQSLSPQQISGLKKYINLVRCWISKVVHYWHLKLLSSNTWMWVSPVINVSSGGQFCRKKKKAPFESHKLHYHQTSSNNLTASKYLLWILELFYRWSNAQCLIPDTASVL